MKNAQREERRHKIKTHIADVSINVFLYSCAEKQLIWKEIKRGIKMERKEQATGLVLEKQVKEMSDLIYKP